MKFKYSLLFLLLFSISVLAQTKVVVLDTGLNINDTRLSPHLCDGGHKDFTHTQLEDVNGHGTHIVGLIEQYAGDSDYCLIIVKYYKESNKNENMSSYMEALKYAFSLNPNIINFSGSGPVFDEDERLEIKNHPGVIMIVAAGNNGTSLDKTPYYPASYESENILVVGSVDWLTGNKSKFSNYGHRVTNWEVGDYVKSTLPNGEEGYMQGTSQATAEFCGRYIKQMEKR
jgi:subtilisin family serine protease